MPYFVYKITAGATALIKNLEKLNEFEAYKDAKLDCREARKTISGDGIQVKVIFADNTLHAEELLMDKRDQPILQEWEK
ncbi:MAG: hypothetical protein OEY36_11485 [Gammaproteobacteria bacterium]|nr:hypothetical protein [Gammaproteobacteria bacterium]